MAERSEFSPKIYHQPDMSGETGGATSDVEEGLAAGGEQEVAEYLESLGRGRGASERHESGNALESTLRKHPSKETLLSTTRRIAIGNEEERTGGELTMDFVVGRQADILKDRRMATSIPFEVLQTENLAQGLDPETRQQLKGELEEKIEEAQKTDDEGAEQAWKELLGNLDYFGIATIGGYGLREVNFRKEQIDSYEREKGKKVNIRYKKIPQTAVYFGEKKEREVFAEWTLDMEAELIVRHLLYKNWNNYNFHRENLSGLVKLYFGPVPSAEGIRRLFTLRGREKGGPTQTLTGVEYEEGKEFGEMVETAQRLYYIAGLSEKPEAFKRLMDTPGWKQFIFPEGTDEETVREWVGDPEEWTPEITREEVDEILRNPKKRDQLLQGKRTSNTLEDEQEKGYRGRLTQKNIFAESDSEVIEKLDESIRQFIAGEDYADDPVKREEAMAAQVLAYRTFKLWILADELGWEAFDDRANFDDYDKDDPLKGIAIEFENGPAASDFGKLTDPWFYMLKSYRQGRDHGPVASFKHGYRNFLVSVYNHMGYEVEIEGKEGPEARSLMEMWWGLPKAEKLEVHRLDKNGNPVVDEEDYPKEPARRIGDLEWGIELHPEQLRSVYLSSFMAGREDGAYPLIYKTDLTERELTDYGFWRKFWKLLDVGIKPGVTFKGRMRGWPDKNLRKEKVKEHKVEIIRNFIRGLQSLPQWGDWELKEMEYYDVEKTQKRKATINQRILEVAEGALSQYGVKLELHSGPGFLRRGI